jgi:hypothetical protein
MSSKRETSPLLIKFIVIFLFRMTYTKIWRCTLPHLHLYQITLAHMFLVIVMWSASPLVSNCSSADGDGHFSIPTLLISKVPSILAMNFARILTNHLPDHLMASSDGFS